MVMKRMSEVPCPFRDRAKQDKTRQDRQGKTRQDRQDRPLSEGEAEAGAGGDHERLASPEGLQ